jgi:hypothetical protein
LYFGYFLSRRINYNYCTLFSVMLVKGPAA